MSSDTRNHCRIKCHCTCTGYLEKEDTNLQHNTLGIYPIAHYALHWYNLWAVKYSQNTEMCNTFKQSPRYSPIYSTVKLIPSIQISHLHQTSLDQMAEHEQVVRQSTDCPEPLLLCQPLKHNTIII